MKESYFLELIINFKLATFKKKIERPLEKFKTLRNLLKEESLIFFQTTLFCHAIFSFVK